MRNRVDLPFPTTPTLTTTDQATCRINSAIMSSLQSRKDEILAKKAKLAELKRQRELRQKEFTSNRQSFDAGEVNKECTVAGIRD